MPFKLFAKILSSMVGLELTSWLVYANPEWGTAAFVLVICVVGLLSLYKLEYGVYAMMGELVLGSQGYLLSMPVGGFTVSIRLALFGVVMLAWVVSVWKTGRVYFFTSPFWKLYVALWTFLGVGVLVGFLFGNSLSNIFFDWNGYLYFGAAVAFPQAIRSKQQVETALTIIGTGVLVLAVQTVLLLFLFSHQEVFQHFLPATYSWIRDFRLGEITRQNNGFYRIFFQSHIYVVYALGFAFSAGLYYWRWPMVTMLGIAPTMIFLSYSRSFWVSTIATIGVLAVLAVWKLGRSVKRVVAVLAVMGSLGVAGYGIALGIINVPLPGGAGSGVSAASLLSERTQDPTKEAAGSSRMALLKPLVAENLEHPILGSGFGTTVTYATADPRALADNPDGLYTTFAFEWGYLDLWLKLGVAGVFVYGLLVVVLMLRGFDLIQRQVHDNDKVILLGCIVGLGAVVVVHSLTPYLNHPLGIGWILFTTTVLGVYGKSSSNRHTNV